ncbi:MAG: NUDIX domain-containing protein [Salinarimonadaceae bacterium]|nr:MAG: NUDIX domain-containing protein [Salinarimonadaceae bacterium]
MTLGARAVVHDPAQGVLLIRHTYTPGWQFPGGGVERGEAIGEALERELREEACIALRAEPVLHGLFFNRAASDRDHVAVYRVDDFAVIGEKRPDWEIAEARFFSLDDLPDGVSEGTLRRLREIFAGEPVSPDW